MLYTEFINKVKEETIIQADNGFWYLEPDWRHIMYTLKLDPAQVTDYTFGWTEIENILMLESEKRNVIESKKGKVVEWIYDIITTKIEPAILEEETDYIKAVTDFMKQNHITKENEDAEWNKFKET